ADPLAALTADAALDVTLGARGPVTVVLGTLTDLSLDNVRERLEEALRAADGSTEFTAARVIRVDDQLLILSGNDGDTVTVAAAAANPATVAELMLDAAGGAVLTEGLINGELRLTRTPAFDLTMTAVPGPGTDTRRVTLATFPQTLDEARSAVENGIQRVGVAVSSPAFTGAVVRVVDDRLLVTPGAGNVTVDPFAETGIGPDTAAELKLAAADSLAADGLLSGDLSAFTGLSFVTYEIQVTIGGAGPYTRQLSSGPGDLPAAAVVLQAAIRDNAVEDTFRNATVTANLTLGRLLITPGNPRDAVAFAATPADADTAANLGLDNLMPAGGLLGGVPNSFATLDLEITLGPDVRTLEMTAPPQTLDEAATLLQQAIRDADPAHPSFSGARVRVVDDRLLVTSGDAGESVAFTVPTSPVSRLKLDAPSAVVAGDDALLSGNLEAFPAFPAGPAVDVRIGDEGPNTAVLATTPTTLAEARDSLEAAIRAARSSPSFHNARVEIAGDRLVVVPGLPEEVTITATVDDATTVDDLGFVSGVRRVGALLSGRLGATVHFTDDAPQIIARMFPGPTELTLDLGALLPFADLAAVRDQLRARLRNGPGAAFQNAEVIVLDGEALLIVPGEDGARIELDNTLNDPTTLADLALALGQAVGTQDNLGPPMSLLRTTVFGRLHLQEIVLASEVLFTQTLDVERRHVGCVRFSYLPPGSACPRRFRSQPELAVELAVRTALEARTRQLGLAA
ncbi:MAG: hypothetical protein GY841_11560, partial [FCB group bacterium]|nr:hypothetical protein [FCB group bacterium]